MKNLRMTLTHRDRERGAIALLVAVMWTALFGMAVVAVDFGYLYTKKRGMQSAVDGALKAAMPVFMANGGGTAGANAAQDPATKVAQLSGFTTSEISFLTGLPNNQFGVKIQRSHPTFFGGLFGIGTKTLSAQATGELTGGSGGAAIWAGDPSACGGNWDLNTGLDIRGNGYLTVNGDVQSKNKIHFGAPNPMCNNPTICQVTGTVTRGSGCMFFDDAPGPTGNITNGGTASGSPVDPINQSLLNLNTKCTVGTMFSSLGGLPFAPEAGGCNALPSAVYCSSTTIQVIPSGPAGSICPVAASFFSAADIMVMTNGNVDLTPHPNALGIVFYSNQILGGPTAIFMSSGAGGAVQIRGQVYAPAGKIDFGTDTTNLVVGGTLAGRVVNIALGNGASWVFNGGGGGGTGWRVRF
jgi:hypothetical protein